MNISNYNIYRVTLIYNKKISRLLAFIYALYHLSGALIDTINFPVFIMLKGALFNGLKFSRTMSKIIRVIKIIFIVDFNRDFNKKLKILLKFKKRVFTLIKENLFNKCWKVYSRDCTVLLKEVN